MLSSLKLKLVLQIPYFGAFLVIYQSSGALSTMCLYTKE